jgi:hypothetical protein
MMRVTIGERLHISFKPTSPIPVEPIPEQSAPVWVEPEVAGPVIRLADAPSAVSKPCVSPGRYTEGCPCDYCRIRTAELRQTEYLGPPRVRGEMVWLKKDVAILQIEGRPPISPDEHANNRRR